MYVPFPPDLPRTARLSTARTPPTPYTTPLLVPCVSVSAAAVARPPFAELRNAFTPPPLALARARPSPPPPSFPHAVFAQDARLSPRAHRGGPPRRARRSARRVTVSRCRNPHSPARRS